MEIVFAAAALSVSLVAGLLLVFDVVLMPGLATLDDREFLRTFKVIDRVIQDNQPVFLLVWVGSILAVVASGLLALFRSSGAVRVLVLVAVVAYLLGVQVLTVVGNIPLNNQVQRLDLDAMGADELAGARATFESRWNTWNRSRTIVACATAMLLLGALTQL